MGRTVAIALLLSLLPPAVPAAAHPGHGADSVTVQGDSFRYSPGTVTVGVGDTVIWFWEGTLFRNHSVTSDPGQPEQFDSDAGAAPSTIAHPFGDAFSHSFTEQGTFAYHCKVHPTMRGVVEVVRVVDPVPGAPRISGVRIDSGRRPVAALRVSERADLVGRIAARHDGRWRETESFYERVRAGRNRVRIPVRGLAKGRYRLSLVAYDAADRRSNVARARFTLG